MLNGIRVVEFEGLGPAPFAAMHLADLGAEVIVIHRKSASNPVAGEKSLLDRGKKSIVLNLKDETDADIARALVRSADVLIEGLRPGVMEKLGFGPEACQSDNPKLVYGRMTGWGQSGPRAFQAGHDLNYIATSGALWYASPPGQPPMTPATLVGDIGGGANYLVIGILSGLLNAARTGKGTVVDAAIVDGSAHMMNLLMTIRQNGQMQDARGESLLDGPHWSRVYECQDGEFISVQCLEPQFYAEFLSLMDLSADPAFAHQYDKNKWPELTDRLATMFSSQPSSHWASLFDQSDACVAVVKSPQAAASDPHNVERNVWQTENGALQAAPAPRFDGVTPRINPAPEKDGDRTHILLDLKEKGLIS